MGHTNSRGDESMQIKHTFLFTLILGFGWAGYLFGYILGPDPASNGIFGDTQACSTAGCHVGNPVNTTTANGGVSITGLPATWVPGQAYPLTITVRRTGAVLFGFQLSAVVDATNAQAGTLTPGSARVKLITGSGPAGQIQYAEHSDARVQPTGTFTVTWTAPAGASAGRVRFNLAGNAANGNIENTGDFIYTRVDRIDPVASTGTSVRAFTLVDRGGVSLITDGAGPAPEVGYTRIQPNAGSTTPAGVAIFGSRTNGVLVSETGVPASRVLLTGRIYAEIGGAVNTGLAIANPNNLSVDIAFNFTDANGSDLGFGFLQIPANGQITKFLNQDPFNSPVSLQGTFSFSSSLPVGVVALRSYINTKNDFLITTLPVIDTSLPANTGTIILPHFADGNGWVTQILLVNPTTAAMSGTIQFTDDNGGSVTAGGFPTSYTVRPRSSQKLVTPGSAPITIGGAVRIVPTAGGAAPTPLVVFTYRPLGDVISEAGVPTLNGTAFRMYVESSGTNGESGNIQTGIAIANSTTAAADVSFALSALDGSTAGLPAPVTVTIPASGHTGKFLAQLFPSGLPNSFKGILRISTASDGVSVVGLRARYNERAFPENFIITTTPPTLEGTPATAVESFFPDLANGGGYTTQFILFSGSAGQSSSGNLRFVKPDGTPFILNLN